MNSPATIRTALKFDSTAFPRLPLLWVMPMVVATWAILASVLSQNVQNYWILISLTTVFCKCLVTASYLIKTSTHCNAWDESLLNCPPLVYLYMHLLSIMFFVDVFYISMRVSGHFQKFSIIYDCASFMVSSSFKLVIY